MKPWLVSRSGRSHIFGLMAKAFQGMAELTFKRDPSTESCAGEDCENPDCKNGECPQHSVVSELTDEPAESSPASFEGPVDVAGDAQSFMGPVFEEVSQ